MRKIFLDCGAHCGCSRRYFSQAFNTDGSWEIYSFEPNPLLAEYCDDLINKAVSTTNGAATLYTYFKTGGSTINKTKDRILMGKTNTTMRAEISLRKQIIVETIDIDEYIKKNFSGNDEIWLKLDVEGEEYNILEHMIKNGSIYYVNRIDVEWHDNRCGVDSSKNKELTDKIQSFGIPVYDTWDAMTYEFCKYPK